MMDRELAHCASTDLFVARFRAGALGLITASLCAGPALAQDAGSTEREAADKPPTLAQVVVTARRKEEGLTTVPASVTAYSSDFLQKQNIQSFVDYATKIPNLTFQYGQGADFSATGFSGGRITTIRGVAGANTTAYYINDTPVPASVSPSTLDLDRIEVLKGPQGTLFGASSMGGNLRFITKQPSLVENNYTLEVQGGGTRDAGADYGASGRAGLVLVPDKVALSAAAGYVRESGFIARRFPEPSGNLVTKDDQGRSTSATASVSLRAKLTDQWEATLSGIGEMSELNGYPAAYVPLPGYKPVSYVLDRERDVQEYSKDRWGLGSLVLSYAGNGVSIISSTSYFTRRVREQEDNTEGTNQFIENEFGVDVGHPALLTRNIVDDKRFTQEARISFDEHALVPHLSAIAGVFYQHQSKDFNQPGIYVPELAAAGFDPAYISDGRSPSQENNTAVFGELYYALVPKLNLTLGLRQYWIEQKSDANLSTGIVSAPGGDFVPDLKNNESGLVPKVVLSYEIGDEGNVYASASKGFRVGGSEPPLAQFCAEDLAAIGLTLDDVLSYKSDTLWSYEIGAKSRFADGRLSVSSAAFQIDWSKIQQSVSLPTCAFSFVTNAGKARIRGGEVEISGRPLADVPFTAQLGMGYVDGTLTDPGLIPQQANTRLAQVPEWTGSLSGYYETPLNAGLHLFIAADYSYTGSVKVANSAGGFLTRQSFNMLNGNVGVRFGSSELLLYGKNLLDKRLNYGDLYPNGFERSQMLDDGSFQRLPRAAVSRPRQVGLQYRVEF